MSDLELAPDNPVAELSASATPTPTPKATPKGKGRGRGRKPGAAKKVVVPASTATPVIATTAPRKAAGGRRGRTKQFDSDRMQAAYERMREIKACYSELAAVVKPALIDLADREVELLKNDPSRHQSQPEYHAVINQLDSIRKGRTEEADARLDLDLEAEERRNDANEYIAGQILSNGIDEAEDAFLDATIRRLDLIDSLRTQGLPVDLHDESYNFKTISNEDADNFGPYEVYHNGRIVPYPHRLEGTPAYARNKALWAQPIISIAEATARQQAPKGPVKRRGKDQQDSQNASRKNASSAGESFSASIAPAKHVQSMMSAQPTAIEPEEPSNESTPVPEGNLPPRGREPALPTHASEPDAYGVRTVNKPMPKGEEKSGPSNRFVIPNFMNFEPHEIGFRDSTNERTRGATVAKRGKYYETNDSSTLHLDPMVARHHAGLLIESDFDEELVQRHQVHPRYGFFLPRSKNDAEPPKDVVSGDKPTVFLTPDGRTIHASRTIQRHRTAEENMEAERQRAMRVALAKVCDDNEITEEDIDTPELQDLRAIRDAMNEKRLTEYRSKMSTPAAPEESTSESISPASATETPEQSRGLLTLLDAMTMPPNASTPVPTPAYAPPVITPARAVTRSYDAIRDMLVEHEATEPAPTRPAEDTTALDALANVMLSQPKHSFYDNLYPEPPVTRRMSLGLNRIHDEPMPLPPAVDPALQPFGMPVDNSSLRSTALPSMDDLTARSDAYQGIPPPRSLENGSLYSGHRERSGSFLLDQPRRPLHQDYVPARPVEMMSARDPDHRAYHAEPFPNAYGGTQRPAYQTNSRPPPSSRVPFSNPLSLASPALPPLRPTYGDSSNGSYFGNNTGTGRMSIDGNYPHTMQPTPIHPNSGYHSLASGPPPSQYGSHGLGSPFHTIAPSPSQMHSPPLMPFSHQYMGGSGVDLGGPPRGKPGSASSTPNNGKYRELAPAPLPPHRQGQNQSQELRTINYVPGDNIKDYTPTEQLPARGPQTVRSWNQYSHKNRLGMGQDRRDSS
ncbi:hypothetical protein F5X68DRAFT_42740 [Plectosphaerella plurivora]|uniref:Uncharacterized protein n=1 Tax=Plectosphaerella plurivora TaxID=936078 RepID=A0A9P9A7L1_9PEZI|nr:hypothetical protein F5X68DRAFT_42740 [Plectosphaerella plurivora]